MTSIGDHLTTEATAHAERAVDAHAVGDVTGFVVHGATALELALKARIARADPVFLAAQGRGSTSGTWQWLLHVHRDNVVQLPATVKTVDATYAAEFVASNVEPRLAGQIHVAVRLLERRNANLHMGLLVDTKDTSAIHQAFVHLLPDLLDADSRSYWGERWQVLDAKLSGYEVLLRQAVEAKVGLAHDTAVRKHPGLSSPHADLEAAMADRDVDWFTSILTECPLCGFEGAVLYGTPDIASDNDPDGPSAEALFYPDAFTCRWCGLSLGTAEEMTVSGFEFEIPYEDIDVSDWVDRMYRDWEPDEDWIRGR